jgi:hypothetical protein
VNPPFFFSHVDRYLKVSDVRVSSNTESFSDEHVVHTEGLSDPRSEADPDAVDYEKDVKHPVNALNEDVAEDPAEAFDDGLTVMIEELQDPLLKPIYLGLPDLP